MSTSDAEIQALAQGLSNALNGAQIRELRPLSMGASRDMWSFEAVSGGESRRLVLRRDPPSLPRPEQMSREAAVLRSAAGTGAPVPEVIANGIGDEGVGSPYVVMQHVEGETIPRKILRDAEYADARSVMARQFGEIAARIHTIDPNELPGIETKDTYRDWIQEYHASGEPSPALEIALRWLSENQPEPQRPTVVHGDFRLGNVMIDQQGIAAVLDWELAYIGDPILDLGWAATKAWRFGSPHPVAGVGSIEDLVDGYASVAGWRPDPAAVRWWSVFGSLRWGVMCRRQAWRHLSGSENSLELAMIGRRFAENEFDLLLALGHATTEPVDDVLAADIDGQHTDPVFAQPTSSQLLAALKGTLSGSRDYADRLRGNTIDVVHRELLIGDELREQYRQALANAGCEDEIALAQHIKAGNELTEPVIEAVRVGVRARLKVWNPKHLASD